MRPRKALVTAAAALWVAALSGDALAQEQPSEEPSAATPDDDDAPAAADPADAPDAPAATGDSAAPVEAPAGDPGGNPLSLSTLTRRLDAIRNRSDQIRARVDMLKDAVLQGGKGASTTISHVNKMGDQFRLTGLVYVIDGTQIFSQRDDSGALHDKKSMHVLSGPIAPGNHTITVTMTYRGHGYGPFKYLNKQTFTVKGSQTFRAVAGKTIKIDVLGFERTNVPLEQRPAVSFKVSRAK